MLFSIVPTLAIILSSAVVPSALAADHQVIVGGPGVLQFNPSTVTASPGDTVSFTFKQVNHTATQSTFANPCAMADNGFDSGFIPVSADNTDGPFPVAQFTVEDMNPVWVYCRQANHCQQGMVFAINPGDKFPAFQAAAMGIPVGSTLSGTSSSIPPPSTNTATATPSLVTVTATVTISGQQQVTTYGSYPGSAAPTAAVSSDHKVVVGGPNKLFFDPANITAQVGDTVTFQFMQKNHTSTQSTFAEPCISLTQTSTSGQVGFDSGFMPVADNATTFPTFTIQINDTAPIWAYCRQATHCGSGMVFSVNAIESGPNNFAAFQARAKQLNGTSSTSSGAASPTNTTNGASSISSIGVGAGTVAALLSILVGTLL